MKEDKKINKEKAPSEEQKDSKQQLARSIGDYYTKELNEKVDAISVKQMEGILRDFESTDYWFAMLKYLSLRQPLVDSVLRTSNPYTEQHSISQAQGILIGLSDITSYVIELNSPKPNEQEDSGVGGTIV